MDNEQKLMAMFIVSLTIFLLALVGWGVYAARNGQNYAMECLRVGKSLQYRTLEGKDDAVKECR